VGTVADSQPRHKPRRELPAPAAHEVLVDRASRPSIVDRSRHFSYTLKRQNRRAGIAGPNQPPRRRRLAMRPVMIPWPIKKTDPCSSARPANRLAAASARAFACSMDSAFAEYPKNQASRKHAAHVDARSRGACHAAYGSPASQNTGSTRNVRAGDTLCADCVDRGDVLATTMPDERAASIVREGISSDTTPAQLYASIHCPI